jgi:hypothetical protein
LVLSATDSKKKAITRVGCCLRKIFCKSKLFMQNLLNSFRKIPKIIIYFNNLLTRSEGILIVIDFFFLVITLCLLYPAAVSIKQLFK